jgi:predicted AlkP superfamily pyrophosphatase or phosphodiesterase
MKGWLQSVLILALVGAGSAAAEAAPVLMISVDGMKPEYVLEAQAHGLNIPYLRGLMVEGAYAEGVVGVWPTVTYPSHTTLVTGVPPAEHGIYSNLEFDPYQRFKDSWFWYARQIRVPTLWQAAHAKGITTASIGWPVTVGASGIDFLIPEYWRITGPTERLDASDRELIAALSLPTGLLTGMQASLGPYLQGNDTSRQGDEIKTAYALEIIRRQKPGFMTLHLSSLDDAQHGHGVFSREADEVLEAIDGMLARLAQAAHANDPAAVIAVVSDHGFEPVTHELNLYVPFVQAGFIDAARDPEKQTLTVRSWRAQPWFAGGMAAIMLQDPRDKATETAVGALLQSLAADADNGIAAIEDRPQMAKRGGFPDAAFLVVFKPGFYVGLNWSGPLVKAINGAHGGHGFSPDSPEMRASFFLAGKGIARHRNLGVIDMRQVAPTVAQILGIELPAARGAPLRIGE